MLALNLKEAQTSQSQDLFWALIQKAGPLELSTYLNH